MYGSVNKQLISCQNCFRVVPRLGQGNGLKTLSNSECFGGKRNAVAGNRVDTVVRNRQKPQQCRKALQVAVIRHKDDPLPNLFHEDVLTVLFFCGAVAPTRARASSFLRLLDHTQRRITVGRTSLDEWSARRRDLYLTTHNTHNRQTSMPPVGFKPAISAGERPQTARPLGPAPSPYYKSKMADASWWNNLMVHLTQSCFPSLCLSLTHARVRKVEKTSHTL